MTEYGDAILTRHDDGTVTVERADRIVGVTPELLDLAEAWVFPNGDHETIQLDTAGEYVYRKVGEEPLRFMPGRMIFVYERIES